MGNKKEKNHNCGRYAYHGLDRIMHEKARLGILTSLLTQPDGLVFTELKELCSLTDGNLSRHIQALEEAGLLQVKTSFIGRRPQTIFKFTRSVRQRFLQYLEELERVINDAASIEVKKGKKSLSRRLSPA